MGGATVQVHLKGNHFRLLARLLKEGWERLEGFIMEGLDVIRVHASCAGVINGGYLAAVKGLGSRTTLAVATESDVRRRSLLKQQYPTALIAADARSALACAVDVHVLIVTWPCLPYSIRATGSSTRLHTCKGVSTIPPCWSKRW